MMQGTTNIKSWYFFDLDEESHENVWLDLSMSGLFWI